MSNFQCVWKYSCLNLVCTDPKDGWMKSEAYKEKANTRDKLLARIMNGAALIKLERQDDLRTAIRTVANRIEKCTEVDGGIFEHLL